MALAAALHAGALALAGLLSVVAPERSAVVEKGDAAELTWLELEEPHADLEATSPAPSPARPAAPVAAPVARGVPRPHPERPVRAPSQGTEPPVRAAELAAAMVPGTQGEAGTVAPEAGSEAAPSAPGLSLEQLGVGPGVRPWLAPRAELSERERSSRRVENVLRRGLAERDQQLGLGPEGPAVAALIDIVMQSPTAPNTSALLGLRTDAQGQTVHVEVLEASSDSDGWTAIARELERALAARKLRVPPRSGGVSMQLRVVSREALPSGADPGLTMSVFGLNLMEGQGERSTRIDLLTPRLVVTEVAIPNGDGTTIPTVAFVPNILSVVGDPVDIGARARRVVHAHLVSLETHPAESAAP